MAMNNSNYSYQQSGFSSSSYSPSGYSAPYSSTPSGIRSQRPRFGYSGPSMYPRPRSSASKPNPDSYSDSMVNNYGSSSSQIDPSFNNDDGNSYNDSYASSSNYYSANDSYPPGQSYNDPTLIRNETSYMRDNSFLYNDTSMARGYTGRTYPNDDYKTSGILPKPLSQYNAPKYNYSTGFGVNNMVDFKGNIQNQPSFKKKFAKAKRMMSTKSGSSWRCEVCSLDFTSQIPYDMHLRGARHAKKIKAKEALSAVQSKGLQGTVKGSDEEKSLFCELCNVKANSSLQLQTHLEGSKHKNKLQSKDQPQEDSKDQTSASVNGKTNGSLVRTLPSDFDNPQPNKLAKYACEVCCVTVNSEVQLQQHLTSKKHQNKVEGKPVIKGKKNKVNKTDTDTEAAKDGTEAMVTDQTSNEASAKVMGVKTLASSFVQGGTLQ